MVNKKNSEYSPKKELLIRMKDTIRPSDKADANFLKVLIDEEKKK